MPPQDPFASIATPTQSDPFASIAQAPAAPNAGLAPAAGAPKPSLIANAPEESGLTSGPLLSHNPAENDTLMHGGASSRTLQRMAYEGVKTLNPITQVPAMFHAAFDKGPPEEEAGYQGSLPVPLQRFANRTMVQPAINAAQDYAAGKVTPEAALENAPTALGQAAGNVVGGKILESAGGPTGSVLDKTGEMVRGAAKASGIGLSPIEKLVKAAGPSVRDANFPQALQTAAPELARQNALTPVKGVQDMADTAHTAANNLWTQKIEPQITRNANALIDGKQVAGGIRNGIDEGMRDLFPEQAAKAEELASKFDGPLPLSKANAYLKTLNAQLKGFYKMSPEARAAAGVTDGRLSSMEDAASGLRQQMYSKLDSLGETDPAGLRQQYGALKQVQSVFGKRAIVSGRQAPLNLAQIMAIAGGAGEASSALLNGHPGAAVAGAAPIAATTLLKYFNSPDTLTRRGVSGLEVPPAEPPTPAPSVPRSLGAAAAAPQEEVPGPLREHIPGMDRRVAHPDVAYTGSNRRSPIRDTQGVMDTINRDVNMPKAPQAPVRTGNSPRSISAEESNRPGTNYLVKQDGTLTAHSKQFAPEETKPGQAHVTVLSNGDYRVNEGTLTPKMEKGLQSGTKAKNRIH